MAYPNYQDKYSSESIFTPEDFVEYDQKEAFKCPSRVILTFSRKLREHVEESYEHEKVDFTGEFAVLEDYDVGVIGNIGIGGPLTAVVIEELGVLGVSEFIIVGTSGSISKSLSISDIAVVTKAIRDEGVSHHYLPPAKWVNASSGLVEHITENLSGAGLPYLAGPSWTIDAPYRETVAEVQKYQSEGVLTVEMEAATVFAICEYRGYKGAAVLVISDDLSDLSWNPDFSSPQLHANLCQVIDQIIQM